MCAYDSVEIRIKFAHLLLCVDKMTIRNKLTVMEKRGLGNAVSFNSS